MATTELDPVFVRALRLLHSGAKESTAELRALLEEAIRQRKGLPPGPSPSMLTATRRDPTEKRSFDGWRDELDELMPYNKSTSLDSPRDRSGSTGVSSKSHTPSPTPPTAAFSLAFGNGQHSCVSSPGENSSGGDELDFDEGIHLEGLHDCTCCKCKSFNQERGNKLMVCHMCQNMYHQECHSPPVPNEEASDPRLLWYCSACNVAVAEVIKPKALAAPLSSSKGAPNSSTSRRQSRLSISVAKSSPSLSSPTKAQAEKRKGLSSTGASHASPKTKRTSPRIGSSTAKVPSTGKGTSSLMSTADRRLQMMRKRAASRKMKL